MTNLQLRRLNSSADDFDSALTVLLDRDSAEDRAVEESVRGIIRRVRDEGDSALCAFTNQFDAVEVRSAAELEMPRERLDLALEGLEDSLGQALKSAAERIRSYHQKEVQESWSYTDPDGSRLGQKITPLDRVGVYVPGGKAAYPSSVLMTAIPAKVAGVGEIIMTVPTPGGQVNEAVLASACLAGVDRVFTIGGAQAVAALAYGTDTVPAVDKIVGPGNVYVAAAKKLVYGQVGIDMVAGPSEVVVICDDSAVPEWAAMDLFAQAEHDELAQSILITDSPLMADAVEAAAARLLPRMTRREIIAKALSAEGAIIVVRSLDEAVGVSNRIAPEHLELMVADPERLVEKVRHAGAIFAGPYTAEALGDYCAGPNHVLPTAGTARFSSPLGVYDFQKRSSLIQCSAAGADALARIASVLGRCEGLTAHALAAEYRLATGE